MNTLLYFIKVVFERQSKVFMHKLDGSVFNDEKKLCGSLLLD